MLDIGQRVMTRIVGTDSGHDITREDVVGTIVETGPGYVALSLSGIVPRPYRPGDVVTVGADSVRQLDSPAAATLAEWLSTVH